MYQPSLEILEKYAAVLINFALWSGKGVQPGEVVFLAIPESARPILNPLQIAVLKSGAHPILHYTPDETDRLTASDRVFYEHANPEQLTFSPRNYLLARIQDVTHFVSILSTNNKRALQGIDSQKIMARSQALKYYLDARRNKENQGQLTWTLALYGTSAMAAEANLDLEEYWQQIIQACFLDEANPIARWQEVFAQIEKIKQALNKLAIQEVKVSGPEVELKIKLGAKRNWLGGSGRNIPSFELFISPDWRGTSGWVKFNQPLYRYGNLITGVELEFKEGRVVKAKAAENEKLLTDMLAVEGADKVGEFSLTDKRFSRISKFMAETLFDENIGGEFGNFHIALGNAYRDSYPGNPSKLTEQDWQNLGYNNSAVHTDFVSTSDRTVTAKLPDGSQRIVYQNGQFTN